MSTAAIASAVHAAAAPTVGSFATTLTGIQITGDPSYEDWMRELDSIWHSSNAVNWSIGDLMLYGEDKFGEKFAQAVDNTRWKIHTLQNIITTCKAFPQDERRPNLVFSSHAECASLEGENRKQAMDKLESGEWTRAQVRAWKRELKGAPACGKTKLVKVQPKEYYATDKTLVVVFNRDEVPHDVLEWAVRVIAA